MDGDGCWSPSKNAGSFLSGWKGIQTRIIDAMIGSIIPFCLKYSYLGPNLKLCFRRCVEIRCLT